MVNQEEPDDMELCDLCDICKTEVKRKDMQRGFNIYTNDEPPTWQMICNNCLKSIPEDKKGVFTN